MSVRKMGSYVLAASEVELANQREPGHMLDASMITCLKTLCSHIDTFIEEYDGVVFETKVVDHNVQITVECEEVIVDEASSPLYDAMNLCKEVEIYRGTTEDDVKITFILGSVWEDWR